MSEHTIKVKNLSKMYKKVWENNGQMALEEISLTLEAGKIYGLIGRNGAGKTTLLSILSSYIQPSSGTISINGEPLFDNEKYHSEIQFVYQKQFLADSGESYPKVLKYIRKETMFRSNFDWDYAQELVKKFGLPTNKRPHKLSKGMQSTLSAIIGLASRVPITIFDETYLGMDAPMRDLFYKEILREQERYPRTFILSTHLISEMEYLFDHVILLHQGRILMEDTYEAIIDQGFAIAGPVKTIDDFIGNRQVLSTEQLGGYKKVTLLENLTNEERQNLTENGTEISTMTLQDLFIQLTGGNHNENND